MYKQSLLADHPSYYELRPDYWDPPQESLPLQYDHLAKIRLKWRSFPYVLIRATALLGHQLARADKTGGRAVHDWRLTPRCALAPLTPLYSNLATTKPQSVSPNVCKSTHLDKDMQSRNEQTTVELFQMQQILTSNPNMWYCCQISDAANIISSLTTTCTKFSWQNPLNDQLCITASAGQPLGWSY